MRIVGLVSCAFFVATVGCAPSGGNAPSATPDAAQDPSDGARGGAMGADAAGPDMGTGGAASTDAEVVVDDMGRGPAGGDSLPPDAGPAADAGPPGQWQLVWADEFDGDGIDGDKWTFEVNCWGGGNNEDQCYVDEAKNAYVRDGALHIVALADQPSGAVGGPENNPTVVTKGHSSARLLTQGQGDWTYGRVEARLKLPCGQGLWPAFWMMPTNAEYGGWAASGEIDIMEAVNLDCAADGHEVHGTLHYGGGWPENLHTGTHTRTEGSAVTDYHEYAVEWEPGVIRWFVDGVHYATQGGWCSEAEGYPAPFDKDFFVILNVAVGGQWPGPPDANTTFPQRMEVDYVRVYQCQGDVGCGTTDPAVTPVDPPPQCTPDRMTTDANELWLYQEGVNHADWPGANRWQQNPGKVVHEDFDENGDTVWRVRWTDVEGGGNLYIQSSDDRRWDLRNFRETGRLALDLKAVSLGDATAMYLKVDSVHPALGSVNIFDQLRLGEWITVQVPIETFLANPGEAPLDLSSVWTPFVIEPNWAASNIELRLDDIRWVRD